MTVTHKSGVQNYDMAMLFGGSHCFEITEDEVPALEGFQHVDALKFSLPALSPLTTWARIAGEVNQRGGHCLYTRRRAGLYEVVCVFPPRSG